MQAGKTFFNQDTPTLVLRSLFEKYDKNSSGFLERNELKILLEDDLGLDSGQSEVYTLLLDKNGDHNVSFEEFKAWFRSEERFQNIDNPSKYDILCQAVAYFKNFDADDSDTLNHDQFKDFMVSLGYVNQDDIAKAFDVIDCHGNGIISFWEFLKGLNWIPL